MQEVFADFWSLSHAGKQHYLQKTITTAVAAGRGRTQYRGKRKLSNSYFISCLGTNIRVCKDFYEAVHGISHSQVTTFLKNRDKNAIPTECQPKQPATTYPAESLVHVRQHINSFPCIEFQPRCTSCTSNTAYATDLQKCQSGGTCNCLTVSLT